MTPAGPSAAGSSSRSRPDGTAPPRATAPRSAAGGPVTSRTAAGAPRAATRTGSVPPRQRPARPAGPAETPAGRATPTARKAQPAPRQTQPVPRKPQPATRKAAPTQKAAPIRKPAQKTAAARKPAQKTLPARKAAPAARSGAPAARTAPQRTRSAPGSSGPSARPLARSPQPGLRRGPGGTGAGNKVGGNGGGNGRGRPPRPPRPPRARPPRLRRVRIANPDRRLRFAMVAALTVFTVFGARLFQLQGLDSASLAAKAYASRLNTLPLPAHRGDILDTDGVTLATTFDRVTITLDQTLIPQYRLRDKDPTHLKGVAGAAAGLSPVLGISVPDLTRKLTGDRRFVYLVKNVEPQVWRDVDALSIPGVIPESTSRRVYPGQTVGASLIGFLDSTGKPQSGIERSYNSLLKGTDGQLSYEKGKGGQQIGTGVTTETEPVAGQDIQLTINADLQYRAQAVTATAVKATAAQSATAVVLDVKTGDVLALADAPTFDANAPGAAPAANLENRALTDVFEPGSTSKVITAAAALQEGVAKPTTRLTVPPLLPRGVAGTFHDAEVHGTEKLTFAGVLAQSSNIGTIKVGERMSPATMHQYLMKFGIGSRTGVGLPESPGILADSKDWDGRQRYTVLFGQGLAVTSLQSASVFATIGNNGVRIAPRLIKAEGPDAQHLTAQPGGARTRVVSARTAKQLREMMEGVVGADGTAEKASIEGYRVAGKTGTAQAFSAKCSCYSGYTASFVGMAPADNPRLVVAVFIQQPVNGHFGGSVAAPVFKELMTYALQQEGIAPTGTKAPKVPVYWH